MSARTERSTAPAATLPCPRTHTDAGADPGRSRKPGCAFARTGPDRTESDLISLSMSRTSRDQAPLRLVGRYLHKQMRLGPATQAALLSRMLPTVVFRQGRKIIVTALRRATGCDANLRLSPQVFEIQRSHPALEEDFGGGRNARAPAHWT